MRQLFTLFLLALSLTATGHPADSTSQSVRWMRVDSTKHRSFFRKIGRVVTGFVRGFNDIDTAYIEPQAYNFTAMLQNTNTYEVYRLSGKDAGQSITFAPDMSYRVGPYLGWRWVFLGYTFDVKHFGIGKGDEGRQEYDLSLYSSQVGIDIYYRQTGNDYHIRHINLGEDIDTKVLNGAAFSGLKSSIKGFNLYYILNHRKFSYPAAFSQSTIQRRSAGSPLVGIAYTSHKLSVDWEQLDALVRERMGHTATLDTTLRFGTVRYTDVSISGGYGYNWVFAHNWLLAGSLSLALAYKRNTSDSEHNRFSLRDFSFSKVNLDAIGRFGLVYNNMRWYAGASAILHAYNYRNERFRTNNVFGSLNIYIGFNFGRRKSAR